MLVPRAVDDETYRKVRMKAAERETSVSALIAEFLFSFTQPNARIQCTGRCLAAFRQRYLFERAALCP
jgi:hypothetical protein